MKPDTRTIDKFYKGDIVKLEMGEGHPANGVEVLVLDRHYCFVLHNRKSIEIPPDTKATILNRYSGTMPGIPLADLVEEIYPVEAEYNDCPVKTIDLAAKFEKHREGIEEYNDFEASIKEYQHIQTDFWSDFTFDEICKAQYSSIFMTRWSEIFEEHPTYFIINKIRLSDWHWGSYSDKDWNSIVSHYNSIRRFNFGEGFEVRLDHTTWCNPKGYAKHTRTSEDATYLDGEFAFMIYKDGKHVLTIGFSPVSKGLLVNQIQCKSKKGNRWMYKLPKHYFDYALEKLAEAFDCDIFLAEGSSLADSIRNSYGENENTPKMTAEAYERVALLYKRVLADFKRSHCDIKTKGIKYYKLCPR